METGKIIKWLKKVGDKIKLRDTDPAGDSYVTAMAAHPRHLPDDSSFLSFANNTVQGVSQVTPIDSARAFV